MSPDQSQLADYGENKSHLELRKQYGYSHIVPDLNGQRCNNFHMAATLSEMAGMPGLIFKSVQGPCESCCGLVYGIQKSNGSHLKTLPENVSSAIRTSCIFWSVQRRLNANVRRDSSAT